MTSALIMSRRTKQSGGFRFQGDAFDEAIEAQVEIQPGLFAIGDDVQAGSQLIVNASNSRFSCFPLASPEVSLGCLLYFLSILFIILQGPMI